jgi:hypothetical protein
MGSDDILRLASVEDTTSCQKTDDNYTSALTQKRAAKRLQIESNCSSIRNHSLAGSRIKLSAGISSVVDIVADEDKILGEQLDHTINKPCMYQGREPMLPRPGRLSGRLTPNPDMGLAPKRIHDPVMMTRSYSLWVLTGRNGRKLVPKAFGLLRIKLA